MQGQQNKSEKYFLNANMSELYPNLFKLLWYDSLPCYMLPGLSEEHLLKSCELGGEKVDCWKLFSKIPTDQGMCCGLNYEKAIKKSGYSDLVEEMQNSVEFTEEDIKEKKKVPGAVGLKNGLKLVVDLHSNSESFGSVSQDFAGFRAFIGQPTEFPAMDENGILLEPGHQHYLSLSSQIYMATGIERLKPEDRHCFFPHEGNLDFYEKYTFQNCRFECGIKIVEESLKCIPWYLPQGQNSTMCDPWRAREFSQKLGKIHSDRDLCRNCLPDCEMVETSVMLSTARFR